MKLLRFGVLLPALVAGLLVTSAAPAHDGDKTGSKSGRVPLPVHSVAEGDKCVEPTEEMRRNHMEKILHQRDLTMHEGIRTKQHSLKNCVNCHADPKTNSVLGKDGFCESCHRYAAVRIDCFSCHTDKRETAGGAAPAGASRALNAAAQGVTKP